MLFDKEKVLAQADGVLGLLASVPKLNNVQTVNGSSITEICKRAFNQGVSGQFHCTTPARARSVPQTVFISSSEHVRGLSEDPEVAKQQEGVLSDAQNLLQDTIQYLSQASIWYYKAAVGEHLRLRSGINIYLGAANRHDIRLLRMAHVMFPVPQTNERFLREFSLVYLPEFEKPAILVFPDKRLTIMLGSGYFGELKKGVFRMLWYEASFRNILGLHASLKVVTTKDYQRIAVVVLGLSGTGKSSTVMSQQVADGFQAIYQDDFIGLDAEKFAIWGTELGLFLKTDGIIPEEQPAIYQALMDPRTFWENVFVDSQGIPDFCNYILTQNGRGVTPRTALPRDVVSQSIDVPDLREMNKVVFVLCSRHNLNPILQRLNSEQFAAAFALGHTTGTSAGGSAEAGKEKFVEGTNPFIVRKPGTDSSLLLQGLRILEKAGIKVECFVLNTGYTGEVARGDGIFQEAVDITIPMCSQVLSAAFQGQLQYSPNQITNTEIPVGPIEGLPNRVLNPILAFAGYEDSFHQQLNELNEKKVEVLNSMEALDPEILRAGLEMYYKV